ncbi:transcriptional regulator, partial [Streptomyces zhihengii]
LRRIREAAAGLDLRPLWTLMPDGGCTHGSAAIAITPSDGLPLTQVLDAVDAALTAPALSGWVRVETPSSLNSAH